MLWLDTQLGLRLVEEAGAQHGLIFGTKFGSESELRA